MNGDRPIRVFILDDHELIRLGVRECLAREAHIEVVGEAATAELAVAMVTRLAVDVALLDVQLPGGSGVQACRDIRAACPQTACLMLTGYTQDKAMLASVMAGSAGYVTKLGVADELAEAVRAVAVGRTWLGPQGRWRILEQLNSLAVAPAAGLCAQDQKVLALIEEGLTNPEIAAALSLPEQSVRDSVSSLLTVVGV